MMLFMDIFIFAILMVACGAAGATGAVFQPGPWYQSLAKPAWTPPNWVFPVAWTTIYLCISFAGARVAGMDGSGTAMAFWAMQAALSTLWTPVFFGWRRLQGALLVMGLLLIAVLGCTVSMFQLDTLAGIAFLPFMAWVTVAAALNASVARLNPDVAPRDMSD
jgi:tryptophan-rich sensory protein